MRNWNTVLTNVLSKISKRDPDLIAYRRADAATIESTVGGCGPYGGRKRFESGARIVYNVPADHIPELLNSGYKNCYQLERKPIGQQIKVPSDVRLRVDKAIASLVGERDGVNLYYGAVEINGAGIRYYGDICLVLKSTIVDNNTLILDRNSYDLACSPLLEKIVTPRGGRTKKQNWRHGQAKKEANRLAGRWGSDLVKMAVIKVLESASSVYRRITTGTISELIRNDEDYIEVIRQTSFTSNDLQEARVAAADVATDGRIADRLSRGPAPSLAELQWRHRRRNAEKALRFRSVDLRTVVSPGRTRL
jgi:hypothetical protein